MARGESHLAARLSYFVGIFLLLFAGFATLAWRTLDQVRVNGPIYDEIIQGNNLIADILPPPQYIIESYLLVLRLKDESDPAEIARLIEKGNALRVGYENGQETWKRQLADGELRNMMTVTAARAAMDFIACATTNICRRSRLASVIARWRCCSACINATRHTALPSTRSPRWRRRAIRPPRHAPTA